MIKLIITFLLFGTLKSMASETIYHNTCVIGVAKIYGAFGIVNFTMDDSSLNILIKKGYSPYRKSDYSNIHSGLALDWSSFSKNHWYGKTTTYNVSVINKESSNEIYLGNSESTYSLDDALEGLPDCVKRN